LDETLASVIDAYGGAEAVGKLKSFRVKAHIVAQVRKKLGSTRRDFVFPDKFRADIDYPDSSEIRILDAEEGWRGDKNQLKNAQGPLKTSMVYQMLRSTIPLVFSIHRDKLQDKGKRIRNGKQCRLILLNWSDELEVVYFVDSSDKLIRRVEGSIKVGGGAMRFATDYGAFKNVDGVMFPFAEENYASSRHTGSTRVQAIIFNPSDPGPFSPKISEK